MLRALIEPGSAAAPGELLALDGDESHHLVRVRRAAAGDAVELLDGAGLRAGGVIEAVERGRRGGDTVAVRVASVDREPAPMPWVEVCAASPKGDRLALMIEQLGEAGAAVWSPLLSERAVVDPGEHKVQRLQRIARESVKVSWRAWALEIGQARTFAEAAAPRHEGEVVVMADFGGEPPRPVGAERVRVLVGPEGGWSDEERSIARERGATIMRLGPHVMRIGTAAVVAAALMRLGGHAAPGDRL